MKVILTRGGRGRMKRFVMLVAIIFAVVFAVVRDATAQEATCTPISAMGKDFRLKPKGAHDVKMFSRPDTDKREGTVVMNVDISTDGTVKDVAILSSSGSEYFDSHAAEYVRRWL